ncbi:MAG: Crp/Fnr family transcriptional regulator [Blastocatellia bacterium]
MIANPFFRRLDRLSRLSNADISALDNLFDEEREITKKKDIVPAGYKLTKVYLVEHGFGIRYKLLPSGKRQVLNVILPGYIIGLSAAIFSRSPWSVMSLTVMSLKAAPFDRFIETCYARPAIAIAMMSLSEQKHAYVSERLADIGRRTPIERVAHFIIEIRERLRAVGYVVGNDLETPLSQEVIADCLGLSMPHVNRMLRKLKEMRLITTRDQVMTLTNQTELGLLAGCDPTMS